MIDSKCTFKYDFRLCSGYSAPPSPGTPLNSIEFLGLQFSLRVL